MPKAGFTAITVSKPLYRMLKELADQRRVKIPRLIEALITSNSTSTSLESEKPDLSLFSENRGGRGLDWSRTKALQAFNPGPNPGGRTKILPPQFSVH